MAQVEELQSTVYVSSEVVVQRPNLVLSKFQGK